MSRRMLVGLGMVAAGLAGGCSDEGQTGFAPLAGTGGAGATGGTAGASTTTSGSGAAAGSTASGGGPVGGQGGSSGGGGAGGVGGEALTAAKCFEDDYLNTMPAGGTDYDQFNPIVGSHCMGTNHQAITGVERVVFLGDSVTVGTPPTLSGDYYRSQLAESLATTFGLPAPNALWKMVNMFDGTSLLQSSGAFASCSKWGARTDDLMTQIGQCFPPETLDARTLVIITMGGNDIQKLTTSAIDGATQAELWAQVEGFVQLNREAIEWLVAPGRFAAGSFVVFSNMYEFTDATGDVESCDVSGLAGFDEPVPSPEELAELVIWANEQYVKTAVDTGTDVIFALEDFCGHGFNADDMSAPCYRGPGSEVWFDLTCIHPNPTGHDHLTDMFMAVVDE